MISRRCHQDAVTRGRCVVSYVVILVWGHAEHHLVIGDRLRWPATTCLPSHIKDDLLNLRLITVDPALHVVGDVLEVPSLTAGENAI